MKLVNKSRKQTLSNDLKEASGFLDRLFGLLIYSTFKALLFKTRFGMHTFFLKEPIDVLVLDKNFSVVKICKNLKPFSLFFWNPKYCWLIELPKNSLSQTDTKLGDKLAKFK